MEARCITGLDNLPDDARGGVLTVGNFDGVHLGHQRILSEARGLADAEGMPVVALTFDPPPDLVLRPDDPPQRVTLPEHKARLLCDCGADYAVTAHADLELLSLLPEEFVSDVLVANFAPKHVVEGDNFFYGRKRSGDITTLRSSGLEHGFSVHTAESVLSDFGDGPVQISSTLIRRMLRAGQVERAADALGRPFEMCGTIVAGMRRGRELNYPTANLDSAEQVIPGDGVYAGLARVSGNSYPAAISVGDQPTFGDTGRTVEAFLLDASGEFYGREMALSFTARLRGQRKFESTGALTDQMNKDVEHVREFITKP